MEIKLRDWQEKVFDKYLKLRKETNQNRFLLEATPGAGKTIMAIRLLLHELSEADYKIIVVSPTQSLRTQWVDEAAKLGINLSENFEIDLSSSIETQGWSLCYQILALYKNAERLKEITKAANAVIIFDEIHHLSDGNTWGINAKLAFDDSPLIIGMSGTPFRGDEKTIPFVKYAKDEQCVPDFKYSYSEALEEGEVVRTLIFPYYDGVMTWVGRNGAIEANFETALNDEESNQRLRSALDPEKQFFQKMFKDADDRLDKIRSTTHANAGGLVFCVDQYHAYKALKFIKQTNSDAIIAVSDDPDSHDKIVNFSKSDTKWLISVRQVTEGIDIPRARVAVYGTNVQTQGFFWQVIFRVGRYIKGIENDEAWVYLPEHPTFIKYVESIKKEIIAYANSLQPIHFDDFDMEKFEAKPRSRFFINIDANGKENGHYYNEKRFTIEDIDLARKYQTTNPEAKNIPETIVADIIKYAKIDDRKSIIVSPLGGNRHDQQLSAQKRAITSLVNLIATEISQKTGCEKDVLFSRIHSRCNTSLGIESQGKVGDVSKLIEKRNFLIEHKDDITFWIGK